MNYLDDQASELEFVEFNRQHGGAEVEEDFAYQQKWEQDFKNVYDQVRRFVDQEQKTTLVGGATNSYEKIAMEMFGGAKSVVGAKLFEIASVLRQTGIDKNANPVGVAKVIWDHVVEQVGNADDIDTIVKKAKEIAKNPNTFVKKYMKMSKVGDIIIEKTGAKNAIRMKVARLAWEEASQKTGSEDVDVIQKEATKLAENKAKSYVDEVKEEQKRALQKRIKRGGFY